jgi:hypothetical protein
VVKLILLLVSIQLGLLSTEAIASTPSCHEIKFKSWREDATHSDFYEIDKNHQLKIAVDTTLDSKGDVGIRLMGYNRANGKFVRTYFSKGSADSYSLKPSFINRCGVHQLLILAETGAEYSWGVRVFSYDDGLIKDLGSIDLAVEGEFDAVSVIPFMKFTQKGKSVVISFTKDVISDPGGEHEKKIRKSAIHYVVNGNSLSAVRP